MEKKKGRHEYRVTDSKAKKNAVLHFCNLSGDSIDYS